MIPPDSRQILDDPYYLDIERRLSKLGLGLGGLVLVLLVCFASLKAISGFIAGSVLSYYNFVWMKQGVDRLLAGFQPGSDESSRKGYSQKAERWVIFKYFARFALIGASLYAIFRFRFFNLKAFILGLLLFVMAVLVECLYQVFKTLAEDRDRGRT